MEQMDILLNIADLRMGLRYRFYSYPDGNYGFRCSGFDGNGGRNTRSVVYATKAGCASDIAQNIKNHVLVALGQPEEE